MDLLSTIYIPSKKNYSSGKAFMLPKRSYEGENLCAVSNQNTLLFLSSFPLLQEPVYNDISTAFPTPMDMSGPPVEKMAFNSSSSKSSDFISSNSASNLLHHVFVADVNTPWDIHRVTSRPDKITVLAWEPDSGSGFILADSSGVIEYWQMLDHVLTEWKCTVRTKFSNETFFKADFIPHVKQVFLNVDRLDSYLFNEKFSFRRNSKMSMDFGKINHTSCILVSHSGQAVTLAFPKIQETYSGDLLQDGNLPMINSGLRIGCVNIYSTRRRVKHAAIGFLKDERLVIAVTTGDPKNQVHLFEMNIGISKSLSGTLDLTLTHFPGIYLQSQTNANSLGGRPMNDEDCCNGIVDVLFVTGDDTDSILIASQHPSGGRVELWELKDSNIISCNRNLIQEGNPAPKIAEPCWKYIEVFSGPAAQVVALATPKFAYQTGRAAACYVTIAYSDGSIQCLLRDSLQQIGSVDLPRTGNLCDEPMAKMARITVTISSMCFTATGNALFVVDSLGQLYIYRMSPINDPGGLHSPPHVVTMLEYCLLSNSDWWDLTICIKPGHLEQVIESLTSNFEQQPQHIQNFYLSRLTTIKTSLASLSCNQFKSSETYTNLMFQAAYQTFISLLRPSDFTMGEPSAIETLSSMLTNPFKEETEIDKILPNLQNFRKDFHVEPDQIHPFQHLIQWVTNVAIHLMTSVPDFNSQEANSRVLNDQHFLSMLRELLVLFRIWGISHPGILPNFTKGVDGFDVLAIMFSLVSRFKENPADESMIDECAGLPSKIIIPQINNFIMARGISPIIHESNSPNHLCFEFLRHEVSELATNYISSRINKSVNEGPYSTQQIIDCVRQIYLGKQPFAIKKCTRCDGMTLHTPNSNDYINLMWDKKWISKCPCGGPWKLTCLED